MFDEDEDIAPPTLRSPPSSMRVRDFEVLVEIELSAESGERELAQPSLLSALLSSYDEESTDELPTCRYARVA